MTSNGPFDRKMNGRRHSKDAVAAVPMPVDPPPKRNESVPTLAPYYQFLYPHTYPTNHTSQETGK